MKKQLLIIAAILTCFLFLSYNMSGASLNGDIIYPVISSSVPAPFTSSSASPDDRTLAKHIFSDALSSFEYSEKTTLPTESNTAVPALSVSPSKNEIPFNITETEITKGAFTLSGVEINNETDYELKNALKEVDIPENPTVLIVHTHTSEPYRPSELFPYTPTDNSRTEDIKFNVARVGNELAHELSTYGINVIHDSSINDYPSYNGSYKKTLELIESHLEKNPEIDMVIDLHRDAMERSDGTKISTVCSVNGEKAAQVMFVTGTDRGGLNHPDWRDNFSFAVKLQTIINENFPHLARPVNVRKERFNGHVSKKAVIIEVGTTGNTLEEALLSARALAFSINEFYTG